MRIQPMLLCYVFSFVFGVAYVYFCSLRAGYRPKVNIVIFITCS